MVSIELCTTDGELPGHVEIGETAVTIVMPALLNQAWQIPIEAVLWIDPALTASEAPIAAGSPRIAHLDVGQGQGSMDVLFMFQEPRQFPPFGPGHSDTVPFARGAGTVWVDGLALSVADPQSANAQLDKSALSRLPTLMHASVLVYGTIDEPKISASGFQVKPCRVPMLTEPGRFWYDPEPVPRDGRSAAPSAPSGAGSAVGNAAATEGGAATGTGAPADPRRSTLLAVLAGTLAAAVAALAWAWFTYATNHTWRLAFLAAGLIVGLAVRRFAPGGRASLGLGLTAAALAFASMVAGWVTVSTWEIAKVNNWSFLTAFHSIGDTNGGWAAALPFQGFLTWVELGLASVEAYFVARLPRGAESLMLEGLSSIPGVPPIEPIYPTQPPQPPKPAAPPAPQTSPAPVEGEH